MQKRKFVLERDFGIVLARWVQVELAQLVQKETEHYSGEIDSKTIYDIFTTHFVTDHEPSSLESYQIKRSNNHDEIEITLQENNSKVTISGSGEGTDAQAIASISLSINGHRVTGVSLDHDTVSINESHYICVKSISA